jgi:hypothetical protein
MNYVDKRVLELKEEGIFSADRVETEVISKIINMKKQEYYDIDVSTLESYLGLLAQHILFLQQECNTAEAREIELGNRFKTDALPHVINSKIRSVEERWLYASTIKEDDLGSKFEFWQKAVIEYIFMKHLSDPVVDKLNVLKRIYDDRRMEGKNKYLHKYTDGSSS